MAETMQGLSRTLTCGDARESHIGKTVTVCGWVQRQRDLGRTYFCGFERPHRHRTAGV